MGKGSGDKAEVTEYRMSIHLGVALELDSVNKIIMDEKLAWSGNANSNTTLTINQPNLFGGAKKEGGLVGAVEVLLGQPTQILPAQASARYRRAPNDCPAFRGLTTLMFRGLGQTTTGNGANGFVWKHNTPLIAQKVQVEGTCAPKTPLNPTYAMIGKNANPAHMIYEALVDTEFGMGGPPDLIDVAAFEAAAQTLFNEDFGLTILWMRQTTIEEIVNEILEHIQASFFADPTTGLLSIKLHRDDYVVEDLFVISPDNAKLSDYRIRSGGEIVNELTVSWTNPVNEQTESITSQNIASIESQGGEKVANSRNYYAVRNADLARTLLERDLRESTAPLISCEVQIDRSAWNLKPGDVVLVNWPRRNLYGLVMRVGKVNYGKPGASKVRAALLQDVFSLSHPPIVIAPGTEWENPSAEPTPLTMQLATLPAYFSSNGSIQSAPVDLIEPEVLVMSLADSLDYDSLDYELVAQTPGPDGVPLPLSRGALTLTPLAHLSATLSAAAESELPAALFPDINWSAQVGGFVWIGYGDTNQEIALVTGRTETGWTIARGCLDTTPRSWGAGTPVWAVNPGSSIVDVQVIHAGGETVTYRGLDRTSLGLLDYAAAPDVSATLTERPHLPLRPANVKVGGVAFGAFAIGAATQFEVSWATRSRLLEDTQVLTWTEGAISPEYRQETVLSIYDTATDALIVEYGHLWTETSVVFQRSDFNRYASIRIVVWSRRDDLDSLTGHSVLVTGLSNTGAGPVGPAVPDRTEPPSPIAAPGSGAFSAVAGSEASDDGSRNPTIDFSGEQDNPDAAFVIARYRRSSDVVWTYSESVALRREMVSFKIRGVQSGTTYELGVAYVVNGLISVFRNLPNVTASSLVSSDTVNVGARPSVDINLMLDNQQQAIDDLETVYGDTAAAAASAAAAAASESAAIAAEAAAIIAQAAAQTSADYAGTFASASDTSATNAATSAGTASTSATNASNSATTATGAASTATTQAGLAAGSATNAGNSATAANTSAGLAATHATTAGNSATAAAASSVSASSSYTSARDAASTAFPDTFINNGEAFSYQVSGDPATRLNPTVVAIPGFGPAAEIFAGGAAIGTRQVMAATPGRIIEMTAEVQLATLTGGETPFVRAMAYSLDGVYDIIGAGIGPVTYLTTVGQIATVTRRFSNVAPVGGTAWSVGSVWIRPAVGTGTGVTSKVHVRRLTVKDVTAQVAAEASASAAATSASNASTSAGAAGSSATAAQTSATNASTSAGAASTSATQASNSATTASGHAATAGTSATNAANSATAAGNSATAASGSASTATTKATEAGNSAAAAAASSVSASSSYNAAQSVALLLIPYRAYARENYTSSTSATYATPELAPPVTTGSIQTVANEGQVLQDNALRAIATRGWLPVGSGQTFEAFARAAMSINGSGGNRYRVGFVAYTSSGALAGSIGFFDYDEDWTVADGWRSFSSTTTSAAILAAFSTAAYVRGYFQIWAGVSGTWQLSQMGLRNVTAEAAAASSASAAATSASNASTSAGAAGASATAASGSATTASTAAGNASTFASQASTSANGAATSATNAGTSATNASGSAATATTQASNASSSAASASTSATIAAAVGTGSINRNPMFTAWPGPGTGADGPTGWSWYTPANGTNTKVAGLNGSPNAVRSASSGSGNFGIIISPYVTNWTAGGEWVVVETDITLVSGSLVGTGLYFNPRVGAGSAFTLIKSFATTPDASGVVRGAGVVGSTYRYRLLIDGRAAGVDGFIIYGMTRWTSFAPTVAATIDWHRIGARTATPEEIAAGVALPALQASVTVQAGAITAVQGRTEAWWEVTTMAGSALAAIQAKSDAAGGSQIAMIAGSVALMNTVLGQAEEVLTATGGNVYIKKKLILGPLGEIELDPSYPAIIWSLGSSRLAIGELTNDSMFLWFGPTQTIANMTKANATVWFDKTGGAYFGGQIMAGLLSNSVQGSSLAVPASSEVGPFGTNGNPIAVVWGATFTRVSRRTVNSPLPANPQMTIKLYRTIAGSAETLVGTQNLVGSASTFEFETNDHRIAETVGGSQTYTDTVGGTDNRTFRVEVESRTLGSLPGSSVAGTVTELSSRYAITTSEN